MSERTKIQKYLEYRLEQETKKETWTDYEENRRSAQENLLEDLIDIIKSGDFEIPC